MSSVDPNDRGVLRTAWNGLCDDVRSVGLRTIDQLDDVDNPQELAEALRAVIRMTIMSLQQRLEFDDPDFPVFFRSLDNRYKYAGPDTYITYVTAPVRPDASISGDRRASRSRTCSSAGSGLATWTAPETARSRSPSAAPRKAATGSHSTTHRGHPTAPCPSSIRWSTVASADASTSPTRTICVRPASPSSASMRSGRANRRR